MSTLIKEATIINRGKIQEGDIYIKHGKIEKIGGQIDQPADREIDASGQWVIPGIIDDQVHFREPGLTHKACIATEARAAVAGGVTSFMEMPNTKPGALTQELLQDKYDIAAQTSVANYSFFMGASNENLEEVLKTDPERVCGVKIFMGSSTGNMLVDDRQVLDKLFANVPMLIATHCEDEATIRANTAAAREKYGEHVPIDMHPIIRSVEGCLLSSSLAVELAKKHGTRLHILHISTKDELALFRNDIPLQEKKITAELCVHHAWFNSDDYARLGTKIKCNPAIKSEDHRAALLPALLDNRIDILATDHAPHLMSEKDNAYFKAPSGLPLVQHSLNMMLHLHQQGKISLEKIVEKMCHAPAECFRLLDRGYLEEGYAADLVIIDPKESWTIEKNNIFYRCGWSPLEGMSFKGRVRTTLVNGQAAYENGQIATNVRGERLQFKPLQ